MNYKKHYDTLISRSPKIKPENGYYERHRIIPGCMGGKYVEGNIAWLTAEEHCVAHQLLVKIYPDEVKLVFAAHQMGNRRNKVYGWLRKKHATKMSEMLKGQPGRKGIKRPDVAERNKLKKGKPLLKMKGNNNPSKRIEVKKKISEKLSNKERPYLIERNKKLCSKTAIVVNPFGEKIKVFNIRQFCRENNLNQGNFSKMLSGKTKYKSCKGYTGTYESF